jgi:lipopolysaccharide transport system permease protein
VKLPDRRQLGLAFADIAAGTHTWRPWYTLGTSEVRQRYRRSFFGPFWVSMSMAVQAGVMGFVLAFLFKIEVSRFLPFLCISLVTWTFFMTSIIEGANCFIANSGVILQVKRPLWTYLMLTLWRNAIIYAHTIVVFVIAAAAFGIYPTRHYLLIPLGLVLLVVNVAWMALAAALISARFRDVPILIQNLFSVLVWLTPVFYQPDQLGPQARLITDLNPLTYVIEVARAPFLNQALPAFVWCAAALLACIGWLLTFLLFARTRARVPFWL